MTKKQKPEKEETKTEPLKKTLVVRSGGTKTIESNKPREVNNVSES